MEQNMQQTSNPARRIFVYDGHRFDDPGAEYSVEQVQNPHECSQRRRVAQVEPPVNAQVDEARPWHVGVVDVAEYGVTRTDVCGIIRRTKARVGITASQLCGDVDAEVLE